MMSDQEYRVMRSAEDSHWWYRTLQTQVLTDLARLSVDRGPRTILDAGCGTGGMLARIRAKGGRHDSLIGIDLSPTAVDLCHRRGLESVRRADIGGLPFDDATFDMVLGLDVLSHQRVDQSGALSEMIRVLRPGGYLAVNCAAFACLRGRHDAAVATARRYRPRQLRDLLESRRLEVVRLYAWSAWAFLPVLIWRRISQHGKSKGRQTPLRSDLFSLPRAVNALFEVIAAIDLRICRSLRSPIGTSVYAIAKKAPDCG